MGYTIHKKNMSGRKRTLSRDDGKASDWERILFTKNVHKRCAKALRFCIQPFIRNDKGGQTVVCNATRSFCTARYPVSWWINRMQGWRNRDVLEVLRLVQSRSAEEQTVNTGFAVLIMYYHIDGPSASCAGLAGMVCEHAFYSVRNYVVTYKLDCNRRFVLNTPAIYADDWALSPRRRNASFVWKARVITTDNKKLSIGSFDWLEANHIYRPSRDVSAKDLVVCARCAGFNIRGRHTPKKCDLTYDVLQRRFPNLKKMCLGLHTRKLMLLTSQPIRHNGDVVNVDWNCGNWCWTKIGAKQLKEGYRKIALRRVLLNRCTACEHILHPEELERSCCVECMNDPFLALQHMKNLCAHASNGTQIASMCGKCGVILKLHESSSVKVDWEALPTEYSSRGNWHVDSCKRYRRYQTPAMAARVRKLQSGAFFPCRVAGHTVIPRYILRERDQKCPIIWTGLLRMRYKESE